MCAFILCHPTSSRNVLVCDMTHLYVGHGLIYIYDSDMWDMTHSYIWHYFFMYAYILCHPTSSTNVFVCDMTHLHVWHDSFIYTTWPFHVSTYFVLPNFINKRSCVWHDSSTCVTWLIHMCNTAPSCMHVFCATRLHPGRFMRDINYFCVSDNDIFMHI